MHPENEAALSPVAELLDLPEVRDDLAHFLGEAAAVLEQAAAWVGANEFVLRAIVDGAQLGADLGVAIGWEQAPQKDQLAAAERAAAALESWGLPRHKVSRLPASDKGIALICAMARAKHREPVRVGQRWACGSRAPVVPAELGLDDFTRWLAQALRTEIAAKTDGRIRVGRLSAEDRQDALGLCVDLDEGEADLRDAALAPAEAAASDPTAEELLVRREQAAAARVALAEIEGVLPAALRDVLRRALRQAADGEINLAEIARELGKDPGTVRKQWSDIRRKAVDLLVA